jgi:hypothetical protein
MGNDPSFSTMNDFGNKGRGPFSGQISDFLKRKRRKRQQKQDNYIKTSVYQLVIALAMSGGRKLLVAAQANRFGHLARPDDHRSILPAKTQARQVFFLSRRAGIMRVTVTLSRYNKSLKGM